MSLSYISTILTMIGICCCSQAWREGGANMEEALFSNLSLNLFYIFAFNKEIEIFNRNATLGPCIHHIELHWSHPRPLSLSLSSALGVFRRVVYFVLLLLLLKLLNGWVSEDSVSVRGCSPHHCQPFYPQQVCLLSSISASTSSLQASPASCLFLNVSSTFPPILTVLWQLLHS